ncbi:MAG TPA: MBL fold metallo-hydrolase, partial [Polyangiaceae bacterium]|nr:MBL fold metallo-hydrolase [Polyangiaceae bacterium]
ALAALALALGSAACSSSTLPAPVVAHKPPDAAPVRLGEGAGGGPCSRLSVTRVAHASVLLDFDGAYVLTDPWFSEKSAYHHGEPLGLALSELPPLTAVVASHAHYDHFDIETFAAYPDKRVPFFVGPDMMEAARAGGFTNVRELSPWQSASAGPLTITGAPGAHGVDEVTFVLEGKGRRVYFGGDTKLIPELAEVHRRFPAIDLALLPVNGLHILPAFNQQVVMSADEAARLAGQLAAEVAVPTHYAFRGSWATEAFVLRRDGSPERFVEAARRAAPATRVRVLPPGQRLTIERCLAPAVDQG